MDGVFNINKPCGSTSFSMVSLVRRLTGERRVGHAGTLDPDASGVLPVHFGHGTRVVEYLQELSKTYRAQLELGLTTDTYDASGTVSHRRDPTGVSQEQFLAALAAFRGTIKQTPPMYSAIKWHGKPLYELARSGIEVDRKSRTVIIYSLELIDWQPPAATLDVTCSGGTYIRSLAHDLGQVIGCGAIMKHLVRLEYGPFDIKDAVMPEQLEEAFRKGNWQGYAYPMDTAVAHLPSMVLTPEDLQAVSNGRHINCLEPTSILPESRRRAYTADGRFISVLCYDAETAQWRAEKVFP